MKRHTLIMLILILVTFSVQTLAREFTLPELLTVAETEATPVSPRIKELNTRTNDLELFQTNYSPRLTLTGKPLTVSTGKNDELSFDASGTLAGSIQFPWGLELSTNLNVVNLYDNDARDLTYSFSLQYDIYPGMKTDSLLLQKESKERALQKSLWNLKTARLETERQVIKKFYTTLIVQEKLHLLSESLGESASTLALYRDLYNRGDVSQRELLEKEIAYQSSQISFERSQQTYQNSLKDLLTYVGIPVSDLSAVAEITLSGNLEDVESLKIISPDELPVLEELQSQALQNSVDFKEAQLDLAVAKDDLARMKNWPEVTSAFQYRPNTNLNGTEYDWSLTLSASYTLSDGGRLKLERSQQEELVRDLLETLTNTEIGVYDQLHTQIVNLRIAYMEYLNKELEMTKSRLDLENKVEQFKKGLITVSDLEASQRLVQTAELDLLQKRLDYQASYWDLYQCVYSQSIINEVVQ